MKIQIDKDNLDTIDVRSLRIIMDDDVELELNINKFGQLVINKQQYGDGESAMVILPSVSNEIRIS